MPRLTTAEKLLNETLVEFQDLISREAKPFEHTTLAAKKARYRDCKDDVEQWGQTYTPHYFESPSASFHIDIDALIHYDEKWIFPVHGPREHGKSVRARVALMKRLLNLELRYALFASEHLNLAWAHIEYIFSDLLVNERILSDYGIRIIKKDEQAGKLRLEITIKATKEKRQVMLQAVSYGTSGKGLLFMQYRPDLAIVDDFENTRSSRNSKISRDKLEWIIQELYPAVKKQVIWLGNMGHDSSALYHAMLRIFGTDKKLKDFLKYGSSPGHFARMVHHYDGIPAEARQGAEDMNMYALSFRAITHMEDGTTRYLWTEHHPPSSYEQKKATMGHLYEGEENGYPVKMGKLFKPDYSEIYDKLPAESNFWFTWFDPAWGRSRHSCYKAWVVMTSPDGRNFYIVDAYCRQGTDINEAIQAWYRSFERWESHGLRFGKYENNFGQDDRFEENLDNAQHMHGYRLNVYGESNSGDKIARIQSLENPWNLKSFHWPREMSKDMATLYDQFLAFPDGEYIDGPDAFESCYTRLRRLCGQGKGEVHTSLGKRRYRFRRKSR